MTNPLQLIPIEEINFLKIIQVVGPEWNRFTGNLPYLRKFDRALYDSKKLMVLNDELDNEILSAMKQNYPNSTMYSQLILWKGQLEDNLKIIEGGTRKKFMINFFPAIPEIDFKQLVGKQLDTFQLNLELRLNLGAGNEKIDNINNYCLCNLPFDKVKSYSETIKGI